MKNWSKHIQWHPETVAFPTSEVEIQKIIQQATESGKKIRIIGTGHSFNPLWVTNDILISLDKYQGLVSVDKNQLTATVKGGTKLNMLGDLLFEQGMAMENMGDIDKQSIAGTISTGTHGTGLAFGTMSTQVKAIRFVNGKSEIIECSETQNQDLFKAAQVSLGTLGVITQITLQCVPAYKLALQNSKANINDVINNFQESIENNRNFEFYSFPYTDSAWVKTANIVADQPDKMGISNYLNDVILENYAYKILCEAARFVPAFNQTVCNLSAALIPQVRKVYHSHKVYATTRLVRFNEMEYNIPLETLETVVNEIRRVFNNRKFNVHFPIEHRVVKADDIYLSPAYQRNSAYIACHVYNKKDYKPYFKALEEIFVAHGGRPHWGKKHTLTAEKLSQLYPKFQDFKKHQQEQDPNGLFLNGYLKELLVGSEQ